MRWDKLFDDLESQLERELSAEELDLGAEEERLRLGRLTLRDRIVALAETDEFAIWFGDGERLRVKPVTMGRDWFSADLIEQSARRRQCLVPLSAIVGVSVASGSVARSLERGSADEAHPALAGRLGFGFVLRDLCRRRRAVELVLATSTLHGTIDRVGRDHLDLAMHEPGVARRESAVREVRIVALAGLRFVRL